MFDPKKKIGTLRTYVILSALASIMLSPSTVQSGDLTIVPPEQSISDGIFDGGQSGISLWATREKLCNRLKAVSRTDLGRDTTLFYSNETQTQFYGGRCTAICSLADENSVLRECVQVLGADGCNLYAASKNGKIYDLTVGPEQKTLAQVCNGG
jgi:hypothetical protein